MKKRVLRDALIEKIFEKMLTDTSIYFLSADFGAPALDKLRERFNDRFINVGIAEQNLINIATGLSLEGYTVYVYAIAPFLTMRAYEQIRINLSVLSQIREININLIGVGCGLSYDVTGPTHHCFEDTCIMNVLPHMTIISPSDAVLSENLIDFTLQNSGPKYIRLDGKAQPEIYTDVEIISYEDGFSTLKEGDDLCIVSTGYMTHIAMDLSERLQKEGLCSKVVDVYVLKPVSEKMRVTLAEISKTFGCIVTMEESFLNKGSLDTMVELICRENNSMAKIVKFGFDDKYVFDVGNREHLYKVCELDPDSMIRKIKAEINIKEYGR